MCVRGGRLLMHRLARQLRDVARATHLGICEISRMPFTPIVYPLAVVPVGSYVIACWLLDPEEVARMARR